MFERWSLKFPITLGVTMIIMIVALIVGWVMVLAFVAFQSQQAGFYWTMLSVGTVFLALVLTGVIIYLTLSVKAINLTRRQSNFIDSVTHELKSPIASLKLYLQTLDMREVGKEEQTKFLRFMMDDVERLDNLITHLLEAGYAEKMREHESVAAVDVEGIIQQAVRSVTLRYRVSPDVVQLDLQPCLISMPLVDAAMLFRNLIDNAVKYSGTPPRVTVTVKLDNETMTCRITDNGPGIPQQQRKKIFGRFVRLGKELRREKPGTGLGLHIVSRLVKRANGRVRVVDRDPSKDGPDVKTIFEVTLPSRPDRSSARYASKADGAEPDSSSETFPIPETSAQPRPSPSTPH